MKKIVIATALTLASASAWAVQPAGFYVGANFGQASFDVSKDDLDEIALFAFESNGAVVLDADSSFDDEGSTWSVTGGYRFNPYFAVEISYIDLGEAKYRSDGTVFFPSLGVVDAALDIDLSAKGPAVAAVGFIPVSDRFDLHGRVGMLFADTTIEITADVDGFSASDEMSANSQDLFLGVGAAFHFTENLAANFDYTLFQDVGDEEETGEGDVKSLTLGVTYSF